MKIHACSASTCCLFATDFCIDPSKLSETELLWVIRELLREWIFVSVTLWLLNLLLSSLVLRNWLLGAENLIFDSNRFLAVILSSNWRVENTFLLWLNVRLRSRQKALLSSTHANVRWLLRWRGETRDLSIFPVAHNNSQFLLISGRLHHLDRLVVRFVKRAAKEIGLRRWFRIDAYVGVHA